MNTSKYSPVAKQIPLSKNCIEMVIGTLFGDGHLSKPAKNARLQITHGDPQKFYIKHKSEILKDICPQGVKTKYIYDERFDKKYLSHTLCTYVNEELSTLYKIFYPQRKKIISKKSLSLLTPRSIAYWYMDDGGLGKYKKNPKYKTRVDLFLNTYVSDKEHDLIIDYFKNNYGIVFKKVKNHGKYRLRIGKKQARKFIKIVKPYILPEFQYKIDLL